MENKSELFTELVLQIFRTHGRLIAAGDRLVKPFGQSSARWQVLGALAASPATVPTVARSMGISRQSVQRVADLLVAEGLCEFRPNPSHSTSVLLSPTAEGQKLLKKIAPVQKRWADRTAGRLASKRIAEAIQLLQSVEESV